MTSASLRIAEALFRLADRLPQGHSTLRSEAPIKFGHRFQLDMNGVPSVIALCSVARFPWAVISCLLLLPIGARLDLWQVTARTTGIKS